MDRRALQLAEFHGWSISRLTDGWELETTHGYIAPLYPPIFELIQPYDLAVTVDPTIEPRAIRWTGAESALDLPLVSGDTLLNLLRRVATYEQKVVRCAQPRLFAQLYSILGHRAAQVGCTILISAKPENPATTVTAAGLRRYTTTVPLTAIERLSAVHYHVVRTGDAWRVIKPPYKAHWQATERVYGDVIHAYYTLVGKTISEPSPI